MVVEEGVASIGARAFREFSKLESVQIAESVTVIESGAFGFCPGVTDIDLLGSLTSMGTVAFEECTGLGSVVIPAGVNKMGNGSDGPFDSCVNLHSTGPIGQGTYYISFGWTENIPSHALASSIIESICLPKGLIQLGNSAFWGCEELYSVDIPEGVIEIGSDAFHSCDQLAEVRVPRSIVSVRMSAFGGCNSLTNVYYGGSESEWNEIAIDSRGNVPLTTATIHYNCAGADMPALKRYKVYINLPGYEVFDVSLDDKVADTPVDQYNPQLAHMLIAMCNSVRFLLE